MMNEIDKISRILTEGRVEASPALVYSDVVNKFLRMHSRSHVTKAIAWRYNLKTGKLHTDTGNPYDDIQIGDDNEKGYSPTGYWIPRIHTLIAYGYQMHGSFKYPDNRMIKFVAAKLNAKDIKHIFIVKGD